MPDVVVSSQLQQWAFEKPASTRPDRADSTTSSPDLSHHDPDTLRINSKVVRNTTSSTAPQEQSTFQDRYLSSEEDLSPMDGNTTDDDYDSDVSIHEAEAKQNLFKARTMSISKWDKGKSCDLAVTVAYVSAGRPKVIELAQSPVTEVPPRRSSLAQLPLSTISKLRQQDQQTRRSLIVKSSVNRSVSPALSTTPYAHSNKSAIQLSSRSASGSSLHSSTTTSRSSSPSVDEKQTSTITRPASAAGPRSSLYINSSSRPSIPLTPSTTSPAHAFLSSDPYENATTSAASPIIKQSPHKRLRSISQRLSLARIAITPSTKKWDSRVNGVKAGTPVTPVTPMTAPLPGQGGNKLRRNSRMMPAGSRPGTATTVVADREREANVSPKKAGSKMVARGAGEREPVIELPVWPGENGGAEGKMRKVRKRKSLMDLL